MSRTPPSLEYLVIYNRTLQAALNVPKDDDDAQEEAHILFYTCKPGGVKRDKMLRQVGLAKALISFSEHFTNGRSEACEVVRSARTKLVMLSPEKDFWIHACVNVAYTENKSKDGIVKKEYHESSIQDTVLKTALLRGYQEYRLLYGPFQRLLTKGRTHLERHLEKFFTVWAWKWELEQPTDFVAHLGTPLSAYSKYVIPLVTEVKQLLPEETPVILLSPETLLASSPSPTSPLWHTLPSHLCRLIPPYTPPPLQTQPSTPSSSDPRKSLIKSTNSNNSIISEGNMDVLLRNSNGGGGLGTHSTVNFLSSMNPKKWGGFFTFHGQSKSVPTVPTAQQVLAGGPLPSKSTTAPTTVKANATTTPTSLEQQQQQQQEVPQARTLPVPTMLEVDQKSLDEAIASSSSYSSGTDKDKDATIKQNKVTGKQPTPTHAPSSSMPDFAPALEYLSSATSGFLNVMALPGTMFGGESRPKEEASAGEAASKTEDGDKPEEQSKPVVEVIDVDEGDGDDDEEDRKTDISQKEGEEGKEVDSSTPAQKDEPSIVVEPAEQNESSATQALKEVLAHDTENAEGNEPSTAEEAKREDRGNEHLEVPNSEAPTSPSRGSSRRSSNASEQSSAPLPPPEAFFMPLDVYLEDPERRELRLRRVYHMSVNGIMLALVMRASDGLLSPTDTATSSSRRIASFGGVEVLEGLGYPAYTDLPRGIEYKVIEVLKSARQILEKWERERGPGRPLTPSSSTFPLSSSRSGTSTPPITQMSSGMKNFAIVDAENPGGPVLASLGFSSTAGWLFEGQSALESNEAILEQFSRTTTSQSWYISKRVVKGERTTAGHNEHTTDHGSHHLPGGGGERKVHMEIARKESSLVDVDNDLGMIVRRLEGISF